jgi:ATP synthase F1 gamma subunit
MSAINELKEELEDTQTAEFVTTMLRDISATKLQSIRGQFEANRNYFVELHELMALVQSYAKDINLAVPTTKTNKRIYVAVTSNKRFYGSLNHEIIRFLYTRLLEDRSADSLVVGQTGQQIAGINPLPKRSEFMAFAKDDPTEEELLALIQRLNDYEEVLVIHPTFINSFQQHAKVTDITHVPEASDKPKARSIDYLFEPDIPKIIEFFKTQIRLTLFMRVLLETEVAFTGARLMKMQRAREKANEMIGHQRLVIHKETSTVKNMRLLETFTGFNKKML